MPSSGIAVSYASFIFSFCRNFNTVLHNCYNNLHSHNSVGRFLFSTSSLGFIIVCRCFYDGHSGRCEEISHYSFDLYFSDNDQCWASFQVLAIYMSSLEKCLLNNTLYIKSHVAKSLHSCPTLCHPIDGSPPGSPSLGFSRQEHWSGLPFPSPMRESEKWKWSHSVMSDP